jgi:hypothetical protein
LTSLTQILSHSVAQQYGSTVHTSSEHVLHVVVRCEPVEQTGCEQVPLPPPLLLPPLELPELLPLELPLLEPELLPPLLLPPPVQLVPGQSWATSLTQMLSHAVVQQ